MERNSEGAARRMAGVSVLGRYLSGRVIGPFALFLAVLLMAFSLERLLRLIQIANAQKASAARAAEMLLYLLPHYMGLAVPAALFLAVFIALRRLHEDSELVILQSAGIAPRRLFLPVTALALAGTIALLLLSGYLQPHARYAYRATLHGLAAENPLAGARPGAFTKIGDDAVLRAEKIDAAQGRLEDIFISHRKTEANEATTERVTIAARRGRLTREEATGAPVLLLEEGNLVRERAADGKISRLSFTSFPWQMPGALGEPYGARGQDEREMTLPELWRDTAPARPPGEQTDATPAQKRAEFHKRLVHALSLPFLALWAVPLALIGRGRGGRALGLIPGAALLVFYEKTLGLGESWAAQDALSPLIGLWAPWLALGAGGILFARAAIPARLSVNKAGATP